MITNEQVMALIVSLAEALSAGDAPAAAMNWEVPALVLYDEGNAQIGQIEQATEFYAQAIPWYNQRGDITLKGELENLKPLTQKLAAVTVRWLGFDSAGRESSVERSYYIVRLGDDGRVRVRVALGLL